MKTTNSQVFSPFSLFLIKLNLQTWEVPALLGGSTVIYMQIP